MPLLLDIRSTEHTLDQQQQVAVVFVVGHEIITWTEGAQLCFGMPLGATKTKLHRNRMWLSFGGQGLSILVK